MRALGVLFPFLKREFPKIRGTILGVPIIRTITFWGPYWGSAIWGKYQTYLPDLNAMSVPKFSSSWCEHRTGVYPERELYRGLYGGVL